jgi:hypothetical protein
MRTFEITGEVSIAATITASDEEHAKQQLTALLQQALASYQCDSLYISDDPEWLEVEEVEEEES